MEDIAYLREHGEVKSYAFTVYSETRDVVRFPDPQEYEIQFDQPFRNVIGLDVTEALIPRSQYLIDVHNNRLVMFVGVVRYTFEVPVGDYDRDGLEAALNRILNPTGVRASFFDPLRNIVKFTSRSTLKIDVSASTIASFLGFQTNFLANETVPSKSSGSPDALVKYYWANPYDATSETIGGVDFVNGTATNLDRINDRDAWAFGATLYPTPISSVRYPLFTPIWTTPSFEFAAAQTNDIRIRTLFTFGESFTPVAELEPTLRLPGTVSGDRAPTDRYGFFHTLDSEVENGSYGDLEPSQPDLNIRELFVGDGQWSGGLRIAPRRQSGYWKTAGDPIDHLDENTANLSWTIFATLSYREQSELNAALFRYGTRETFLGFSLQGDRIVYERAQTKQVPQPESVSFTDASNPGIVEEITTTTIDDPSEYGTVSFEVRASSVSVPEESFIAVLFENGWFPGYVSERISTKETFVMNVPWVREAPQGMPVQIRWTGEDYPIDTVQSIVPGHTYATLFVDVATITDVPGSQTDIETNDNRTLPGTLLFYESVNAGHFTLDVSIPPVILTEETPTMTRQMSVQILHGSTFLRVDANNRLSLDSGTVGTFSLTSRSSPDEENNQSSYTWKDTLTETYLSTVTPGTSTANTSFQLDGSGKIYRLHKVDDHRYTISWIQSNGVRTYLARDPFDDAVLRPLSVRDPGNPTRTDAFLLWTLRAVTSASAVKRIHLTNSDPIVTLPTPSQPFDYPEYVHISGTGTVSQVDVDATGAMLFSPAHRVNAKITRTSDVSFEYTTRVLYRDPNADIDVTGSDVFIRFHAPTIETSRRVLLEGLSDGTPYFLEMGVKSDGTVVTRVRYDGTLSEIEDTTPVQGTDRFGMLYGRVTGLASASLEFPIDTSSGITLGPVSSIQDVVIHKDAFVDSTTDHPTLDSTIASLSGSVPTLTFTWGDNATDYRWLGVVLTGLDLDQVSDADASVPGYTFRIREKDRIVYELVSPVIATSFSFTLDLSILGNVERFRAVHALGHPTVGWIGYKDEIVSVLPDTPYGFLVDDEGGISIRNEVSGDIQTYGGLGNNETLITSPKNATIENTLPTLSWTLEDIIYGDTTYLKENFVPLYQVRDSPVFVYSDNTGTEEAFSWDIQPNPPTMTSIQMQSAIQTFTLGGTLGDTSTLRSISVYIQDNTFIDQPVPVRVRLQDAFGVVLDEFAETYDGTHPNPRISFEHVSEPPGALSGQGDIKAITVSYDRFAFPVDVSLDHGRSYTWSIFFEMPAGIVLSFQTPLFENGASLVGSVHALDVNTNELGKVEGFVAMTVQTERTQHTITSPGVTILSPGTFVKLFVPEIEKHSYKHQNYNNRVSGITSFFLSKEFEHQWFEFPETPASYEMVNPIASVVRMTFRFLQDDDTPYNFRGVDHVLKLVIRFLVPKLDVSFQSRLAPQYDPSQISYTGTSECPESDQGCEIRPRDETDDLLRIVDMDRPPTLKGQEEAD